MGYVEEFNSPREIKAEFFSEYLYLVGMLGVAWYAVFEVGDIGIFLRALRDAPTLIIADMVGILILPIILTYFIAQQLATFKVVRFPTAWVASLVITLALMTVQPRDGWADTLRTVFIVPPFIYVVVMLCGGPKGALKFGGGMLLFAGLYAVPLALLYWLESPVIGTVGVIGVTLWISANGGNPPDGGMDGSNY